MINLIRPTIRKIIADLWSNRTRTLLVIASIAVGVFAIGAIMTTYIIFDADIAKSYASAQPANIEIITDSFQDDLVRSVAAMPGVTGAEGRHLVSVRISKDGVSWRPLDIMANKDFAASQINLLTPVDGTPYPQNRQLVVREDMMNSTGFFPGDDALVQLTDGSIRQMEVVGRVGDQYAAGDFAAPPRGYATLDTVDWLGERKDYNRLYVQVEAGDDEVAIAEVAERVEDKLERTGHAVFRTNVNKTTEHPMAATALAMLGVLGALGALITILSSSLIVNTLNALLTQHRRQIGVMKLIGAKNLHISVMYISLIVAYGIIALIFAAPMGAIAGNALAAFMANLMSIELQGFRFIPMVLIVQLFIALAVPLIAGYFPVNRGAKTTVRRAISEENPGEQAGDAGMLERVGLWMKWLSRPIILSIRNTFRRKWRLALTLFTLIVAGSVFIAVFNVRSSLNSFMDILGQHFMADVTVTFKQTYRVSEVADDALSVLGVEMIEGWGSVNAEIVDESDELISNLIMFAPPGESTLLEADMVAGRWLLPQDEKVLVVSDTIWIEYPHLKPGDHLRIKIPGNRIEAWPVVGIFRFTDMRGDSLGYANYETLARLLNAPGQAATYKVVADAETLDRQDAVSKTLDRYLRQQGYKVSNVEAGLVTRQQQSQAMNILVIFLLAMALLTAVVGSIGLAGTMGMNVLERTREIGVMRAIGAVDLEIIKSVVIEGMMIGLISWAVAVALSFPISFALLRIIGQAMLNGIIPLSITLDGFLIWLAVVSGLSILASILPARNAARLTIREVLAYE